MTASATTEASDAAQASPTPQTQVTHGSKVVANIYRCEPRDRSRNRRMLSLQRRRKVYSIDIHKPGEEFAALTKRYPGKLHALKAGVLHGMVVNAGRTHHKAALDFTKEEVENLLNVNLFGALYTARAAVRAFIKLEVKGSIVFTASMASYRPIKANGFSRVPSAPYGASKAGIRNVALTLAMEWAQHGIRVNSVSPGLVKTAMTYCVPQQPDWEQQLKYYGEIWRFGEVQELGGAYVYLLSDAASYTIFVDIPVIGVISKDEGGAVPNLCMMFEDVKLIRIPTVGCENFVRVKSPGKKSITETFTGLEELFWRRCLRLSVGFQAFIPVDCSAYGGGNIRCDAI
ncbi:hypothetical protein BDV23DRAFT_184396 [Aspergillus alliaceus]|uniref:NAD(P)-binding protein n=1 Tax=Petromyces alliaceus TaxID=209559 RepID=A0A5N7C6Z8_PETAA|nr:hypothetical protein BDV23DRAFT_184396 [Aspergillus alliaceus]